MWRTICASLSLRASNRNSSLLTLPFSRCVHHLSGPNTYALTQTTFKITEKTHTCCHESSRTQPHLQQNYNLTVLCVPVLCCVRTVCLASCENNKNPRHTKKFESLKIINSRDDKIRFKFDELNPKKSRNRSNLFPRAWYCRSTESTLTHDHEGNRSRRVLL